MGRTIFLCFFFFAHVISSCHFKDKKAAVTSTHNIHSRLINRLKLKKVRTDSLFNSSKARLSVVFKLTNQDGLEQLKDSVLPDDTDVSYSILKDSTGRIRAILESPYSESGDWYIAYVHYFDEEGKTFAFVKQVNSFNSICTEGVSYETSVK